MGGGGWGVRMEGGSGGKSLRERGTKEKSGTASTVRFPNPPLQTKDAFPLSRLGNLTRHCTDLLHYIMTIQVAKCNMQSAICKAQYAKCNM